MLVATEPWVCTHCGFYSPEPFDDDICPLCQDTDWFCQKCGYTITASSSPKACRGCHTKNSFINLTSYVPD